MDAKFEIIPIHNVFAMQYQTVFRVYFGRAARCRMIASTASYGRDHATSSGTRKT